MAKDKLEYTAQSGMVTISSASESLTGTGASNVITGSNKGTLIKRVYIKSTVDTSQGMVRLFLYDNTNYRLIREIMVPAVDQRNITPAYGYQLNFNKPLIIPDTWRLAASTQIANSFNIVAVGTNWTNPASQTKIEVTGATNFCSIATANSNLDGTGTLGTLITGANNGKLIKSITIKAIGTLAAAGMVRLFMYDGTNTKLFMEISIPASTQSSTVPAFLRTIRFKSGLTLPLNWSIKVSTENANTFQVIADAITWDYV